MLCSALAAVLVCQTARAASVSVTVDGENLSGTSFAYEGRTYVPLVPLLDALGVFSAIYGHIAAYTGYELRLTRSILTGILELGCGIGAMEGAALTPVNLAACAFLIGFGGISVAMQTASVLSGTNIKVSRHIVGRLLNGGISAFIVYTLGSLIL